MDVTAVTSLFNTVGTAGIFLYACYYLMKQQESREAERARDAREREDRLVRSLSETDQYMRTTVAGLVERNAGVIERNTEAMREVASTLESLACHELRKDEIQHMIEERRSLRHGG